VAGALRARTGSDGLIAAVDVVDESSLSSVGAGSALAVLAPGLERDRVDAVARAVTHGPLASPYGVRSLERGHPQRAPRNYWRGPVWANVTWLCAHGLAVHGLEEAPQLLRGRLLEAAGGGGMREYFMPESGRGLGARDFAWTAALVLRELGR
jgi:glycogen debranching enzyme